MVVTTCLAFIVLWKLWGWKPVLAGLFIAPFLLLDVFFFGANFLRVIEGGWVPLTIAAMIGLVVHIWLKGRAYLAEEAQRGHVSMADLAKALSARPPTRAPGTAVFLTADPEVAPVALLHNIKHNKVLHAQNIIVTVKNATSPHIAEEDRLSVVRIDDNFEWATLRFGYMETPDVPAALFGSGAIRQDKAGASFFIGRHMLSPSHEVGLPFWQDIIFIILQRNASDPTEFFQIPPGRVVELGTRVEI